MTPTPLTTEPRPRTTFADLSIGDVIRIDKTERKHLVTDISSNPIRRDARQITSIEIPDSEFGRYDPKAAPKEPFQMYFQNDTLLEDMDIYVAFRWDSNTAYPTFKSNEFNVLGNKYKPHEYMFDSERGLARCRASTFDPTAPNTKVFCEIIDSSLPLHAYGYFVQDDPGDDNLLNTISEAVYIDQAHRTFEQTGESLNSKNLFAAIKAIVAKNDKGTKWLGLNSAVAYCRGLVEATLGSACITPAEPLLSPKTFDKAKYGSFVDLVKADLWLKMDPFGPKSPAFQLSPLAEKQRVKLMKELIQLHDAAGVMWNFDLSDRLERATYVVAKQLEPLLFMSPYDEENSDEVDRIWVKALKDLGPSKSKERYFAAKPETWETRKEEIVRKSHEYGHTPGGWPLGYGDGHIVIDDISDFATAADEAEIEFRSAEKAFSNLKEVAEHIPKDIRFRDLELNTVVVFEDGDSYQTTSLDVEEVTLTLLPKALRKSMLNRKTLVFKSWELVPETVTATLEPPYASSVVCFGDLSEGEIIEETEGGRQWTFTRSDEPVAFLEPVHEVETQENRPKAVSNRSWPLHAFGFQSLREDDFD